MPPRERQRKRRPRNSSVRAHRPQPAEIIVDPKRIVDKLREALISRGLTLVAGEAVGIEGRDVLTATGQRLSSGVGVRATLATSNRVRELGEFIFGNVRSGEDEQLMGQGRD